MHVKVLRKKCQHLKEVNLETGQDGIVAECAVSVGRMRTPHMPTHSQTHTHTHAHTCI